MLAIRGTTGSSGNPPGFTADTEYVVPAERCIWTQVSVAGNSNYRIENVNYIHANGSAEPLSNAELGIIGKSGRFVGFTV